VNSNPLSILRPIISVLCPQVSIVVSTFGFSRFVVSQVLVIFISEAGVDDEVEDAWKKFVVVAEKVRPNL
jgi:hypothetical protein